jgi:hypothetical protein
MERSLISWSWKDIQKSYLTHAEQLAECQRLAIVLNLTLPLEHEMKDLPKMRSDRALVVSKLFRDVKRVNTHLSVLEREIERRNSLVGVL